MKKVINKHEITVPSICPKWTGVKGKHTNQNQQRKAKAKQDRRSHIFFDNNNRQQADARSRQARACIVHIYSKRSLFRITPQEITNIFYNKKTDQNTTENTKYKIHGNKLLFNHHQYWNQYQKSKGRI